MDEETLKIDLKPRERKLLTKLAEQHGVTPNQELEAATLYFLKTHDKKLYEEAKKTADPEALRLLERPEISEKTLAEKVMTGEMVEVHVRLYRPFYDFMKQYLVFFGCKQTVEDLCRSMIYHDVESLYNELKGAPYVDGGDWFDKWPHIYTVASPEPDEEES